MSKATPNEHKFREPWLHAAVAELRPLFSKVELKIPDKIRCAFSLTSAGTKGARKSECWPADASGDHHCEIFISPDIADPVEVLGQLCHALVHACLPVDTGHGVEFKAAANRIGLEGKMRHALPGPILTETLQQIAANIGPLPHARLDLTARILDRPPPADKPKKQGIRMLKAACPDCGYTVRGAGKWLKDVGPPHCPNHGPMALAKADDGSDGEEPAEGITEAPTAPAVPPEVIVMPPSAPPPVQPPAQAV